LKRHPTWCLVGLACATPWGVAQDPTPIPRVEGIAIDGSLADWRDTGTLVSSLADVSGATRTPSDFDPRLRLGWDEAGLLVAVEVDDDAASEYANPRRLFLADSVELFVARDRRVNDYYMYLLSPGLDPDYGEPRDVFFDERDPTINTDTDRSRELRIEKAVTPKSSGAGYVVEARLPWENIGVVPREGQELAFQVYAMDGDPGEDTFRVAWYPAFDTHQDKTRSMYTLRLSGERSSWIDVSVRGELRDLVVVADPHRAGQRVSIEQDGARVAETELAAIDGRARASVGLPPFPPDGSDVQYTVRVGTDVERLVDRRGTVAAIPLAIDSGQIGFEQYVFGGADLPRARFENPESVRSIIGPVEIETRYFDAAHREVASASRPGRYGAVVDIRPRRGPSVRRFFTLYRAPDDVGAPSVRPASVVDAGPLSITLPGGKTLRPSGPPELDLSEEAAVALASGLGDARAAHEADRGWWLAQSRLLYDVRTATPLPRATVVAEPSPVLRLGAPSEVGMKPGVARALDAVCREWLAGNGGEGFVILVARRGVIVFHEAYGTDDGAPMTVDTPGNMASLAKMFSGIVLSTFVDAGLVDLDGPFERDHPAFWGRTDGRALTHRMLHTHTSGLAGLEGTEGPDFAEVQALRYGFIETPVTHLYSGVAVALSMRALEMMTGLLYPEIVAATVVEPLGLSGTRVLDAHRSGTITAKDMATLGQMLLNRGTYGSVRLLSEDMVDAMKPRQLDMIFPDGANANWGVGIWGVVPDLKPPAFGHFAHASYLHVDSGTEIVVALASRERWGNFRGSTRESFFRVIEEHTRER